MSFIPCLLVLVLVLLNLARYCSIAAPELGVLSFTASSAIPSLPSIKSSAAAFFPRLELARSPAIWSKSPV